jgi:hypothetical protein
MSESFYHSGAAQQMQLPAQLGDLWESEIVPQLPAMLDEQARIKKAYQRERSIKRTSDLLRALLAWVLAGCSFRQLGSWAVILGIADISEAAWRKRVRMCGDWLVWLLMELLVPISSVHKPDQTSQPRVILVDGTSLAEMGGSGDDWRVQLAYDLVAGRLVDVRIGDKRQAETLVGLPGQPGDLFLADRGYGRRSNVVAIDGLQAASLLRFSPTQCRLEQEDGSDVAIDPWLEGLQETVEIAEQEGYCVHEEQRVKVRVLALRLPAEAAEKARARVLARAKRKKQAVRPQTLVRAGWVLLLTTLPASRWSAAELFWLYRARWQIELLIKQMKQFLLLVRLRSHHPETVRTTLLAALIAWVLQERESQALLRTLVSTEQPGQESLVQAYLPLIEQWETEEATAESAALAEQTETETTSAEPAPGFLRPVSLWVLTACCLSRWRTLVLGQWSLARVLSCLPRLKRFFCLSPRRRLHQRLWFHAWVQQRFLPSSEAAFP